MKFPEGRLYTIQLTSDEIDFLLQQDCFWKTYPDDSPEDTATLKIHRASDQRRQDRAIAWLYEQSLKRQEWLEEALRRKIRGQCTEEQSSESTTETEKSTT